MWTRPTPVRFQESPAIQYRHTQIEQNQAGPILVDHFQRSRALRSGRHVIAFVDQRLADKLAYALVVVYKENAQSVAHPIAPYPWWPSESANSRQAAYLALATTPQPARLHASRSIDRRYTDLAHCLPASQASAPAANHRSPAAIR